MKKAKIRKTGEIVNIVCFNCTTRRCKYDSVSYIDSKGRKHAVVLFSENKSVVRNGIPSTAMGFIAIDLDANTYKD